MRWALVIVLSVAVLPAPATGALSIEEQVRAIGRELRCPVCQGESVAESPAKLAEEMRNLIRKKLEAGESPEAIKAYFVSKYGNWILLNPPTQGTGLLVWVLAGLAVLGGAGYLASLMRRWRAEPSAPPASARPPHEPSEDPYVLRVRREVAGLEGEG